MFLSIEYGVVYSSIFEMETQLKDPVCKNCRTLFTDNGTFNVIVITMFSFVLTKV